METKVKIPSLEETIARMKKEVIGDMRIPTKTKDFGSLHDFIDANELGGLCEDKIFDALIAHFGGRDKHEGMPQGMLDYINSAQDEVSKWLHNSGLKKAREENRKNEGRFAARCCDLTLEAMKAGKGRAE